MTIGWILQLIALGIYLSPGNATSTTSMSPEQPRRAVDQEDEIIILKIGGSSITNKAREESLNDEALDWFAKLIARSVDPSFLSSDCRVDKNEEESYAKDSNVNKQPKRQFVVVHGAGSFGHHSAKRYGLRCGKVAYLEDFDHPYHPDNIAKRRKFNSLAGEAHDTSDDTMTSEEMMKQRYQMLGLSKTRQSVQKLNAACVSALIENGVNAVGISPGMSVHRLRAHGATGLPKGTPPYDYSRDGSPRGMQDLCESVKQALRAGLVPVVHGDACLLYDEVRAGILGGDTIAEGLATLWDEGMFSKKRKSKISRVIFITDVAGVFTSDPKSDKNARLIRSLNVNRDTGKLVYHSKDSDDKKTEPGDALNVSGSSHAHDVTGGLKAKLAAAVTIVQTGIDVIITQCGSISAEKFVRGDWISCSDVEAGTLLSQQIT